MTRSIRMPSASSAARPRRCRLVLVGGGHSQLEVLRRVARERPAGLDVTLVTREPHATYSGMLPGCVAGHYRPAELQIDLRPLCAAAGARLVVASVDGLDRQARRVMCGAGPALPYDLVSINCGAAPALAGISGAARTGIPVKPIGSFLPRWEAELQTSARASGQARHIAVVGGGAGGVELALAIHHRLAHVAGRRAPSITLFSSGKQLLEDYPRGVQRRFASALAERGIVLRPGSTVVAAEPGLLSLADGRHEPVDQVFWCIQAGAPAWPAESGLAVDEQGFIRVDETLRSVSDPAVFAAGDIASLPAPVPKAGVFAVRQGPVLAGNLMRAAAGMPLHRYRPQRRFLSLISTGDRHAVACRGRWSASGAWVWRWKDWIDRRFVARYGPA